MAVPLPPELTGVNVTRYLTLDSALWFLIVGALMRLDDAEYAQTGTLDAETVRTLLLDAIIAFTQE